MVQTGGSPLTGTTLHLEKGRIGARLGPVVPVTSTTRAAHCQETLLRAPSGRARFLLTE